MRELAQLLINLGGERAKAVPVVNAVGGAVLELLGELGEPVGADDPAGALHPVRVAADPVGLRATTDSSSAARSIRVLSMKSRSRTATSSGSPPRQLGEPVGVDLDGVAVRGGRRGLRLPDEMGSQRRSFAAMNGIVVGLPAKSSMPAARHRSGSPCMTLAVRAMIGVRARPVARSCARIALASS